VDTQSISSKQNDYIQAHVRLAGAVAMRSWPGRAGVIRGLWDTVPAQTPGAAWKVLNSAGVALHYLATYTRRAKGIE